MYSAVINHIYYCVLVCAHRDYRFSGCDVGYWGIGCKNVCHKACSDCDHRTGCCYTVIVGARTPVAGLKFCATRPVAMASVRTARDDGVDTAEDPPDAMRSHSRSSRTQAPVIGHATLQVKSNTSEGTQGSPAIPEAKFTEMSTEDYMVVDEPEVTLAQQPPKTRNGSSFVGTVTTMQVTVYKYDELVTKLIWISVMTVVAIAMVFVIMFVVFFNCYGVSKLDDCRTQNRRMTSIVKNEGKNGNNT